MKQKTNRNSLVRLGYGLLLAILLSTSSSVIAQNSHTIKGVILNGRTSSPLPDVSVTVKGTGSGTQTGANGEYSIAAKPGDVIVFSFTGYESHEEKVGNQTN